MQIQSLLIKDIVKDMELYPRNRVNWLTAHQYGLAMKGGAKFPPVLVALEKGKYILLDGFHRVEACETIGIDRVKAKVLKGLSRKEMYLKGVEENIKNPKALGVDERRQICFNCREKYKMPDNEICELMYIPLDKLEPFMLDQVAFVGRLEKAVILKSAVKHLAGQKLNSSFEEEQRIYSAHSQISLLDEFLFMIEHNHLDMENKEIREKIDKIVELLGAKV